MKIREHISPPYRTYTGVVLNQNQCDALNIISDRINSFIKKGINPPEELLNGAHNLFNSYALLCIK